ncbi:MAG: rod-binding protein [Armatimonadetes bacterium]|nr:rod-binding protein [Armatimonadota bacterium]
MTTATTIANPTKVEGTWGHPAGRRDAKLQEQCRAFESVLTGEMLKGMRKTVTDTKGWFAESSAERSTREMYDQRLSSLLAERGSLAVGREIYDKVKVSLNGIRTIPAANEGQAAAAVSPNPALGAMLTAAA